MTELLWPRADKVTQGRPLPGGDGRPRVPFVQAEGIARPPLLLPRGKDTAVAAPCPAAAAPSQVSSGLVPCVVPGKPSASSCSCVGCWGGRAGVSVHHLSSVL